MTTIQLKLLGMVQDHLTQALDERSTAEKNELIAKALGVLYVLQINLNPTGKNLNYGQFAPRGEHLLQREWAKRAPSNRGDF